MRLATATTAPRCAQRMLPLLCLLGLASACVHVGWHGVPGYSVTEVETVTLPASGVQRLEARNELGSIELTSGSATEIVVQARKTAHAKDERGARAALAAMRVEARVDGERAVIAWRWEGARPADAGGWIDFVTSAPPACEAMLLTRHGGIAVRGREHRVEATSENGGIVLRQCVGPVVATSHNGSIELSGPTRLLELVTHNGAIDASLEADGPVGGTIRTQNGSIALALGPKVQAQVIAGADNGRIHSERPWADAVGGRSYLIGTQGAAATRLQLQSNNGGITIR